MAGNKNRVAATQTDKRQADVIPAAQAAPLPDGTAEQQQQMVLEAGKHLSLEEKAAAAAELAEKAARLLLLAEQAEAERVKQLEANQNAVIDRTQAEALQGKVSTWIKPLLLAAAGIADAEAAAQALYREQLAMLQEQLQTVAEITPFLIGCIPGYPVTEKGKPAGINSVLSGETEASPAVFKAAQAIKAFNTWRINYTIGWQVYTKAFCTGVKLAGKIIGAIKGAIAQGTAQAERLKQLEALQAETTLTNEQAAELLTVKAAVAVYQTANEGLTEAADVLTQARKQALAEQPVRMALTCLPELTEATTAAETAIENLQKALTGEGKQAELAVAALRLPAADKVSIERLLTILLAGANNPELLIDEQALIYQAAELIGARISAKMAA